MKQLFAFTLMMAFSSTHINGQSTYIYKPQGASTSVKVPGNWIIATCNGTTATVLPGILDTLLFSNCSGSNAVIDTNLNVNYIQLKSNYTGTVT